MENEIKERLIDLFGDRVAFHRTERLLYSSDLASLPKMVTGLIQNMPDAVVLVRTRDELSALVGLAAGRGIPLVPRGAGTAGYGGAVPAKGGIVVDFSMMNGILEVDVKGNKAVVEPGVIWNDLEWHLRQRGLALRVYPGSALSATVGGWLANGGGVGIGGFEYGYLRDNIIEVETVTVGGISVIKGSDLDLVEGMAGTTGFVTRVVLCVREGAPDIPVVAAFPTLKGLADSFRMIREERLPLWEVGYKDGLNVRMTHEAMEKQAKKGPVCHEVHAPALPADRYLATYVYPQGRESKVKAQLERIITAAGGEALGREETEYEWSERFYGMRLKALGPSIIPSEVIIPTDSLLEFAEKAGKKIEGLSFNGTLVKGGVESAFLGYRLDDERRPGYALAFVNSLIPMKIAKKLGGRPYTTGMMLSGFAGDILGKDRLERAYNFKKKVDPEGILNPGKVFPPSLDSKSPVKMVKLMTSLATKQIGAIRMIDALVGGKAKGMTTEGDTALEKMPYGKEAVWDALACANCGYCRGNCTEFKSIGWESSSPRGKFHFLREYIKNNASFDQRMAEMFFVCSTCRRCNDTCQVMSSIDEHWSLTLRPLLWQQGFNPPRVHQGNAHNIMVSHNPGALSQDERTAWMTPDLKRSEEGEIGYFAGCSASYSGSTRNLAVNAVRLLNKGGIEPVYMGTDEWCCGGSMFIAGCLDDVLETVGHNIDQMNKRGVKTLVTSCSGCWLHLAHFYPVLARRLNKPFDITVKHVTQMLSELIGADRLKCKFPVDLTVTYHDPCHIGRGGGIYDEPRNVLSAIPNLEVIEMERSRENASCCGRHVMRYPRLGMSINENRLNEVKATGAPVLVGACPTCETNFRLGIGETGSNLEVFDITDLVCHSVGLPTLVMSKLMRLGVM